MRKFLIISVSILAFFGSTTSFATDLKQSITKGDVTVSYYQEGIKDSEGNRINQKSGNKFLKNTKEGIQVKTKNKTTLFYTPFSRYNREVAKKAGDTNTIKNNDGNNYAMILDFISFGRFIEISPKGKYVSYIINGFEWYDTQSFSMMGVKDGSHPLEWSTHGGNDIGGKRQPNGERFFYVDQDKLKYTMSGKFPKSNILVQKINSLKKITFDKNYIYITDRKNTFDRNGEIYTMKFKLSNLK